MSYTQQLRLRVQAARGPTVRPVVRAAPRAPLATSVPRSAGGPGTELKKILSWFGIRDRGGCGCTDRARRMDQWGSRGCRQNLDTILDWLQGEARRRGIPYVRCVARLAVLSAISRAERHGY